MTNDAKQVWEAYCAGEIEKLTPLLVARGIELDKDQPHISGERYFMQAVTTTSGKKVILLGHIAATGMRVVIKATSDAAGARELEHERTCRSVLQEIKFAYEAFLTPKELIFEKKGEMVLSIQEFIDQEISFLDRSIAEQFSFALRSFEAQEGAHATTYEHIRLITRTFGSMNSEAYLERFAEFTERIHAHAESTHRTELLNSSKEFLAANRETIDQYGRFLTHTDFVPHNFRIRGTDLFLLDYSSLRFGNKYEGWARFLNFMTLYNPELEQALVQYVKDNRTPEELLSLKLMRVYRLGEILSYYASTIDVTSGDQRTLNTARIEFWTQVLESQLNDAPLDTTILNEYRSKRNTLRSEEEKKRQIGLH